MVIQTGDNKFGVAEWIVDPIAGLGTHTTIASALASASSGDTIFIKPGTYTENLTLVAGVNLTAFEGDGQTPTVTIEGTCSFSSAGTVTLTGIRLQTNGAFLLSVTGSAASIVNLQSCYLNISDNTGIEFTSSDAGSQINIQNCQGNLGTTGIGIYTSSSAGSLSFNNTVITNSGGSTTASSNSAGQVSWSWGGCFSPLSCSAGTLTIQWAFVNTLAQNAISVTTSGTGQCDVYDSAFASGTQSCFSIGAGSIVNIYTNATCNSSNANVLTGAGTLQYGTIYFSGSSSGHNVTTETQFSRIPVDGGRLIQQVRTLNTTKTQYTAIPAIPRDTTIPQNTEGSEVLSLAITPTSATNILWIQLNLTGAVDNTTNNNLEICLFQDSTANALETQTYDLRAVSQEGCVYFYFSYFMVAGTTSSTTFRIRLGGQNLGTLTVNGVNNVALYGGTMGTVMTITEIQV